MYSRLSSHGGEVPALKIKYVPPGGWLIYITITVRRASTSAEPRALQLVVPRFAIFEHGQQIGHWTFLLLENACGPR